MKPSPSSDHDEHDRILIKLLKDLAASEPDYPPELLAARRAAFQAQVQELSRVDTAEELSAGDREVVKLLGRLKSAQEEYPAELLAARRAAFLSEMARAGGGTSILEQLRASLQRIFQKTTTPAVRSPEFRRISLVIASLMAAVMIGSLFFLRAERSSQPSPSQAAAAPTDLLPAQTGEVALTICKTDDRSSSCPPGELDPSRDLADPGNGLARPAVSKDARASQDGVHRAAYVNDGRGGASWISGSPDSWIKIDLGRVTNINTVSLQKGNPGSSTDDDPGQFVIAVALSDMYADGDSSNDYMEYTQVFDSEQAGFSGRVSHMETIRTQFPPVRARFLKITFENAGAAIEKVGVFMIEPPLLAEGPASTSQDDLPGITLTPTSTDTPSPLDTAMSAPTGTGLPTGTAVSIPTHTPTASDTLTPLPTNTRPAADTSTPIPADPVPTVVPPTSIPPTSIPPTLTSTPGSSDPIVVTGNGQTLTFTCYGHDVEIRGHANTVTLLGSCRSITVTGNGNSVFWQFGSPVITDRGTDNIIRQL
ncbi:MAG TPA: DUF3060 domain-containing protein [Anaerolineales bacterium]|nr:DUF3060 domain-containing protein [Anaerolineales bacterium]